MRASTKKRNATGASLQWRSRLRRKEHRQAEETPMPKKTGIVFNHKSKYRKLADIEWDADNSFYFMPCTDNAQIGERMKTERDPNPTDKNPSTAYPVLGLFISLCVPICMNDVNEGQPAPEDPPEEKAAALTHLLIGTDPWPEVGPLLASSPSTRASKPV
jgi:hypothetical protein